MRTPRDLVAHVGHGSEHDEGPAWEENPPEPALLPVPPAFLCPRQDSNLRHPLQEFSLVRSRAMIAAIAIAIAVAEDLPPSPPTLTTSKGWTTSSPSYRAPARKCPTTADAKAWVGGNTTDLVVRA
ncbi:hypothetical protein TNCT6_35010 [Streptomyces sp. 6-11-2]|nr:hypothetical protein TNCT6_35010 [Streptomyces sp. 6-11-2]